MSHEYPYFHRLADLGMQYYEIGDTDLTDGESIINQIGRSGHLYTRHATQEVQANLLSVLAKPTFIGERFEELTGNYDQFPHNVRMYYTGVQTLSTVVHAGERRALIPRNTFHSFQLRISESRPIKYPSPSPAILDLILPYNNALMAGMSGFERGMIPLAPELVEREFGLVNTIPGYESTAQVMSWSKHSRHVRDCLRRVDLSGEGDVLRTSGLADEFPRLPETIKRADAVHTENKRMLMLIPPFQYDGEGELTFEGAELFGRALDTCGDQLIEFAQIAGDIQDYLFKAGLLTQAGNQRGSTSRRARTLSAIMAGHKTMWGGLNFSEVEIPQNVKTLLDTNNDPTILQHFRTTA